MRKNVRKNIMEKSFNLIQILNMIIKNVADNKDVVMCYYNLLSAGPEIYKHSVKVALLATILGTRHYKNEIQITQLFNSALLHDYGKLYTPRNILEKPGKLSKDERMVIELHPVAGYFYLSEQTNLSLNTLMGVLDHHEKEDGSGYGLGKKGDEITQFGKIIAIADVYAAMTSNRVYHKKESSDSVKKFICDNCNSHFNTALVVDFFEQLDSIQYEIDLEYLVHQLEIKITTIVIDKQDSYTNMRYIIK